MKRKFIKALSFLFVFLFLLAAVPFGASAGVTDATENIATSDVMTDLERFGIDISSYQKDLDAKHCRMLNFLEFGYCYYSVASDYALYVYMWNPTGKPIEIGGKNYIQMALLNSKGEKTKDFTKYPLEYVSHSTQQGYEHLFYKFRVGGTSGVQGYLEKAMRRYDISGVELHFQGNNNATESGVAATYSFRGYMSYRGADTSARNTLRQHVSDRITAGLELHGTTWKTSTSDKGVDYAYEVFSVYFSVPNDIINDYGDKNDATKGLKQVDGEFSEYKINGIVTDNKTAYNLIYDDLGKSKNVGFKFITRKLETIAGTSSQWVRYNFNGISSYVGKDSISGIQGVYYSNRFTNSTLLSQNEFLAAFNALREEKGLFYHFKEADQGRKTGKQSYTIKDTDDWGKSIASYADSSRGKFWEWLSGNGNLMDESKDYGSIKALEVVTSDKVLSIYNDAYISESLFIDKNDVSSLRNFVYEETAKNNTVYLMRFAVCDYYNSPIVLMEEDAVFDTVNGEHYYFEKTIFLDFDIMYFTWENEYEQKTVIPVVASPIDIVGSITPPTEPSVLGNVMNNITNVFNNAKDFTETIAKFKAIVLLIGGLLILAVLVWILNKLGILSVLGKAISGLFKGIGKLFGFTEKRIDKHRERKEHKEDRIWKREEEERKRASEKRDFEKHEQDKKERAQRYEQSAREHSWRQRDRADVEKRRKEAESNRKTDEALRLFNSKLEVERAHKKILEDGKANKNHKPKKSKGKKKGKK